MFCKFFRNIMPTLGQKNCHFSADKKQSSACGAPILCRLKTHLLGGLSEVSCPLITDSSDAEVRFSPVLGGQSLRPTFSPVHVQAVRCIYVFYLTIFATIRVFFNYHTKSLIVGFTRVLVIPDCTMRRCQAAFPF